MPPQHCNGVESDLVCICVYNRATICKYNHGVYLDLCVLCKRCKFDVLTDIAEEITFSKFVAVSYFGLSCCGLCHWLCYSYEGKPYFTTFKEICNSYSIKTGVITRNVGFIFADYVPCLDNSFSIKKQYSFSLNENAPSLKCLCLVAVFSMFTRWSDFQPFLYRIKAVKLLEAAKFDIAANCSLKTVVYYS